MKEFYINVCKGMVIPIIPVAIVLTMIAGFSDEPFEIYYGCTTIAIVLLLIQFGCNTVCRMKVSKWCVFFCLMAISVNVIQMNHAFSERMVYEQNLENSTKATVLKDCINYYNATENLLDSLGVDVDDPILSSDAGSQYLDTKCKIDSIIDANK